jgi:hypothetical protein
LKGDSGPASSFALGADFLFEILEASGDAFLGLFDPLFELFEAISRFLIGLFESLFELLESLVNHTALVSQSAGHRNAEANDQRKELPNGLADRRVYSLIKLVDGTAHFGEFLDATLNLIPEIRDLGIKRCAHVGLLCASPGSHARIVSLPIQK